MTAAHGMFLVQVRIAKLLVIEWILTFTFYSMWIL
jgi:hypothetical protein